MSLSATEESERALGWVHKLSRYSTPTTLRAIAELFLTATPFAAVWFGMYWAVVQGSFLLYVVLLPLAVGFLVRLFLIQHDCGHHSFFPNRLLNDNVGRMISVLTLTPYEHWRRAHAIHHATSGNLSRRGVGDVDTLTVAEYRARSKWTRARYRLYRNPLIMFAIGPAFIFVVQNRLPAGFFRGWRHWISTMGTNLAVAAVAAVVISFVGIRAFLLVHVPIMLVSATVGGWLFYVQHQFETTCWDRRETWSVREAALHGSSHYDLPLVLKWFTANIGVHHVHHLCSRIPYYRLPKVLRDHPDLSAIGRVTLLQSFKCIRLALWDEESRRLISFRDLARSAH